MFIRDEDPRDDEALSLFLLSFRLFCLPIHLSL
jgi:hypothetical protein